MSNDTKTLQLKIITVKGSICIHNFRKELNCRSMTVLWSKIYNHHALNDVTEPLKAGEVKRDSSFTLIAPCIGSISHDNTVLSKVTAEISEPGDIGKESKYPTYVSNLR